MKNKMQEILSTKDDTPAKPQIFVYTKVYCRYTGGIWTKLRLILFTLLPETVINVNKHNYSGSSGIFLASNHERIVKVHLEFVLRIPICFWPAATTRGWQWPTCATLFIQSRWGSFFSLYRYTPSPRTIFRGSCLNNKLNCTVLYRTVLYCTVLYCTVLYCTVLYCTVLYCTVLYNT